MGKLEATRVANPFISTDYLSALLTVQFSSYVCCYSNISPRPNVMRIEFRFCLQHGEIYYTDITVSSIRPRNMTPHNSVANKSWQIKIY
jgi:hypothetical protein